MEDSSMEMLEGDEITCLLTENIKTEQKLEFDSIIKKEPQDYQSDETSNNCLFGSSNDNISKDFSSFKDFIKTEPFLPLEKEDDIKEDKLEKLPLKLEDPLEISSTISFRIKGDQSTSTREHNYCSLRNEQTINQTSAKHNNTKKFICTLCNYQTNVNQVFTIHVNAVHKKLKPYNCNQCDYKCSRKGQLTKHVNKVHKDIKLYQCCQCDYKSSRKGQLTKHVKKVHKDIKPYQCGQCDYKSSCKYRLHRHVNSVHKGIKSYQCGQCDYSCSRKLDLIRHVNDVHKKLRN